MERVQALIDKLQEQVKLKNDVPKMQLIVQMLQLELRKLQKNDSLKEIAIIENEIKLENQPKISAQVGEEINTSFLQKESLNDKLKVEKTELQQSLKKAAVQDLKKAIDINSKFVFINELFAGDEIRYENSVKKINAFGHIAEAEFWIQQELKSKLQWDNSSETVLQFEELVRRRFS